MTLKMRAGEINDLGLGTCPKCKEWRALTSFYWLDAKLPRKDRRRCCSKCNAAHKRESDIFFFVKKTISAHKLMSGECDYTFDDLKELHKWQAFQCPYCNEPIHYKFTLEHIVPQEHGGRNIKKNLLLVCTTCNSSKQDFEVIYWLTTKKFTVKPKILLRIKEAYDVHEFNFPGSCANCSGKTQSPGICTANPGSPSRRCIQRPGGIGS